MRKPIVILCLLVASGAWAGRKFSVPVHVDTVNHQAYGNLGTARASADTVQQIGCTVSVNTLGAVAAYCWATDAAGTYLGCMSSTASIISIAQAVTPSSYLSFIVDPATGWCTSIEVVNGSSYG